MTALDTIGRSALLFLEVGIHAVGPVRLAVHVDGIDGLEDVRDADIHRTAVRAIAAAGTADLRRFLHDGDDFFNRLFFFITQRCEAGEGLDVVFHLFQ